jgi:hypothetical protein
MSILLNTKNSYDIKQEVVAAYNKVKIKLMHDNSDAGNALRSSLDNFVESVRPDIDDYISLLNDIYLYQNAIDHTKNIDLFTASDEILTKLKNIILDAKVGLGDVSQTNSAKENVYGGRYDYIYGYIRNNIQILNSDNIPSIVLATLEGIDSKQDITSASNIILDLYTIQQKSSTILSNIDAVTGVKLNQYILASSFYNPTNIFAPLSDTRAAVGMVQIIDSIVGTPHNLNPDNWPGVNWTARDILTNLKNFMGFFHAYPLNYSFLAMVIIASIYEDPSVVLNGLEPHTILSDLSLDLTTSGMSFNEIVENILAIDSDTITDSASLVAALYQCFKYGAGSSIKGQADILYNFLPSDVYAKSSDFIGLFNEIWLQVEAYLDKPISSDINYINLASYVAATTSAIVPDDELVRAVEMDMIASGNDPSRIANNIMQQIINLLDNGGYAWISNQIQELNNNLPQADFASFFFFQFYVDMINDLYRSFNFGPYYPNLVSDVEGHVRLTSAITSQLVSTLNMLATNGGIVDYESLASEIAEIISPSASDFVASLEQDIALGNQNIENIKYLFSRLDGKTSSEIVANMYSAWGGAYVSASPGARILAREIYESVTPVSNIAAYFIANSNVYPKYDQTYQNFIAKTIDNIVNPFNSDEQLINNLEADMICSNKAASEIVPIIQNIDAFDGASFAANFYREIGFPYCSPYAGFMELSSKIEDYHKADYSNTVTKSFGDLDTYPKEKYLNLCIKQDEQFLVGHSVFYMFDREYKGVSLYEMEELFTIAGRHSARSQCAKYLSTNYATDLYVTLSSPGGTTGSAEITGCTAVIDPGIFTAYCEAVFINALSV